MIPERSEVSIAQMDGLVIARDVQHRGFEALDQVDESPIGALVGVRSLVLDDVAEIHHQLGTLEVIHPIHELLDEGLGMVGQLAELPFVPSHWAEMHVSDERESHGRYLVRRHDRAQVTLR